MGDKVEFDPAAIDRAIARLTALLALIDQQSGAVAELQRITQPGQAPSTRAFHALLTRSMARLHEQHEAFRRDVQNQIEDLRKTKQSYAATDQAGAHAFATVDEQL